MRSKALEGNEFWVDCLLLVVGCGLLVIGSVLAGKLYSSIVEEEGNIPEYEKFRINRGDNSVSLSGVEGSF